MDIAPKTEKGTLFVSIHTQRRQNFLWILRDHNHWKQEDTVSPIEFIVVVNRRESVYLVQIPPLVDSPLILKKSLERYFLYENFLYPPGRRGLGGLI